MCVCEFLFFGVFLSSLLLHDQTFVDGSYLRRRVCVWWTRGAATLVVEFSRA